VIRCLDCGVNVETATPTQKRCKTCGEKRNAAARRAYQRKKRGAK
jgi:DNA-directed RNA polymerase subunit RPC12/RpoP